MFPNIRAVFVHNYSNPLHNDDAAQRYVAAKIVAERL